jgi:hypothetical protein
MYVCIRERLEAYNVSGTLGALCVCVCIYIHTYMYIYIYIYIYPREDMESDNVATLGTL